MKNCIEDFALLKIPKHSRHHTPIYFGATAGMRLLWYVNYSLFIIFIFYLMFQDLIFPYLFLHLSFSFTFFFYYLLVRETINLVIIYYKILVTPCKSTSLIKRMDKFLSFLGRKKAYMAG